jgi:4-amino-4-deoxy-L-arabinose transferase-like glycosyltransferase
MIRRHPVALALLCLLVTACVGLLLRPLAPIDETRYLAVAWEMRHSGNWLVPTKNFAVYSDKPPLLFWMINVVWMVTGVSELAARLVGPILAAVTLGLTAVLARRLWSDDEGIGGRAALGLAGLVVFALSGSLTMFDVPLAACVLLGLIALCAAGQAPQSLRPWAGFGAAIALGTLTKGPVILFHLLPAALLLPLWSRETFAWRLLPARLGFGLLVGVALLALWLVPAITLGGAEYRQAILWKQSAGRLSESFAHARPWWFYLALFPLAAFPLLWSPALWKAGRRTRWLADRGLRLCLIWIAGALILFSLTSGKQIHYLVPELPALALIAGRLGRGVPRFGLQPAIALLALLAVVAVLAAAGVLPLGRAGSLFEPRSALLVWALLILAVCWLAARNRGFAGAAILSLGALLATNLLIGLTDTARIYSTHPIAARIAPHQQNGIAYLGPSYHAEFNFAGRLTAPVAEPDGPEALRDWIARHPLGLIVARTDQVVLPCPPEETILFRNRDYGIWSASSSPFVPCPEP